MDTEFHYYSLFIICKCAGLSDEESAIISYSSQYVDDNSCEYEILRSNHEPYRNIRTSILNPIEIAFDSNETLQKFHFIKGEHDVHPLAVTANSINARQILEKAFNSHNLYLIGIALHAYADTWAHENFTGTNDAFNSGQGFIASLTPNIGHADFGLAPDFIGIKWVDSRFDRTIYNNEKFLECAGHIFDWLEWHFKKPVRLNAKASALSALSEIYGTHKEFNLFRHTMQSIHRTKKYILYAHKEFGSNLPRYCKTEWSDAALRKIGNKLYFKYQEYRSSHWYRFQEAAKAFL